MKKREESLKAKSRNLSIVEGSAYSIMDGFGHRFITPYAVALNVSNSFIGLLSSVPSLLGSLAQLPASKLLEKNSRKKIVFTSVIIQALMWLPLISVGFIHYFFKTGIFLTSFLLLVSYVLIICSGAFASPAWNSWMKDLVPKDKAASYFGKRNRIVGAVALISTFAAGFILNVSQEDNFIFGFTIIFLIAFLGRIISGLLFKKHYEPKRKSLPKDYYFSFADFIKKMPGNNFGRYAIFTSLILFSAAIASPFFAVYMLKDLQFNYIQFTIVSISAIVASILFMPVWGKIADRYGNVKIMKLSGIFIFLIPALWLMSSFIATEYTVYLLIYLILIEIFSGFIWAGFNLASSTFIYDSVTKERIALCVAYTNLLGSAGIFFGAYIGGLLASLENNILGLSPILFVFLLSASLRLISGFLLLPLVKEVRPVKKWHNYFIEKILDYSSWFYNPRRIKHV